MTPELNFVKYAKPEIGDTVFYPCTNDLGVVKEIKSDQLKVTFFRDKEDVNTWFTHEEKDLVGYNLVTQLEAFYVFKPQKADVDVDNSVVYDYGLDRWGRVKIDGDNCTIYWIIERGKLRISTMYNKKI